MYTRGNMNRNEDSDNKLNALQRGNTRWRIAITYES
jgi:hypothetical protein